mmetsp:Transcript_53113/g.151337  ORF Transcript_53113/g.151337 Transcript_53113/m.151337 type:complete len:295 (+) Transcript_53113:65-949(+)
MALRTLPALIALAPLVAALSQTEEQIDEDAQSSFLIQQQLAPFAEESYQPRWIGTARNLAMAYVPYNFGFTVAHSLPLEQWGPLSPVGQEVSSVTGCPLMYTPGKHWPKEAAERYFGNRTVFGILRDPLERLVAQFRGSGKWDVPAEHAACDVNAGVKKLLQDYNASGNPYWKECRLLPQAEFFDMPYGITEPIDNLRFPTSANEMLEAHGYSIHIEQKDIRHVSGCDDKWAGDLDADTRRLAQDIYTRDYELLCQHFRYCEAGESRCLQHVHGMCPEQLFLWSKGAGRYVRRP